MTRASYTHSFGALFSGFRAQRCFRHLTDDQLRNAIRSCNAWSWKPVREKWSADQATRDAWVSHALEIQEDQGCSRYNIEQIVHCRPDYLSTVAQRYDTLVFFEQRWDELSVCRSVRCALGVQCATCQDVMFQDEWAPHPWRASASWFRDGVLYCPACWQRCSGFAPRREITDLYEIEWLLSEVKYLKRGMTC